MTFGEYYPTSAQEDAPELRADYLRLAGFDEGVVALLADTKVETPSVGLHDIEALLSRGCSHDETARILL